MTDLLYGGAHYEDELHALFPTAMISDASDDVHEARVKIDVDIDEWEYMRVAFLNGLFDFSLSMQLRARDDDGEFLRHVKQWRDDYPQYFKEADDD